MPPNSIYSKAYPASRRSSRVLKNTIMTEEGYNSGHLQRQLKKIQMKQANNKIFYLFCTIQRSY